MPESGEEFSERPDLHRKLAEAALFMAGRSLTVKEIMNAIPGLTPARARNALESLVASYSKDGALEVVKDASDPPGYKMKVKDEFLSQVRRLSSFTDISEGETKTLAVIAFYQPIKQSEIVKIRGNRAYEQVKNLVQAGLIVAEPKGVTRVLRTTERFTDYFGAPIESLRGKLDPRDKAIIDGQVEAAKEEAAAEEISAAPSAEPKEDGEEMEEEEKS